MISSAKVLGVIISSDLKWSAHINSITTKAAKRLYLLRQLKRAGIAHNDLFRFHCSVIRSVPEYACQVFHCNLPLYGDLLTFCFLLWTKQLPFSVTESTINNPFSKNERCK